MIYAVDITTPANTPQTSLLKTPLTVTNGLVYKVEFYFPTGSEGKMGVAVFDGLYQCWPSTVGEFFIGSDVNISFDDLYAKSTAPYEFQCYTYNEDDIFDHMVSIRIGLVSNEVYMARFLPNKTYEYLTELIAKMEMERVELYKRQKGRVIRSPVELFQKRAKRASE